MKRLDARLALLAGGLIAAAGQLVLLSTTLGVRGPEEVAGPVSRAVGVLLVLLVGGHLARSRLRGSGEGVSGEDTFGAGAPERPGTDRELAGADFAATVAEARREALESGSVETGIEAVRPRLRDTLLATLTASGRSKSAAEAKLRSGDWTSDPVVAAVISPECDPPPARFRDRLWAWLRPGRAVRQRIRRTVTEVARVGERELPSAADTAPHPRVPRASPPIDTLPPEHEPIPLNGAAVERADADGSDGRDQPTRDGSDRPHAVSGANQEPAAPDDGTTPRGPAAGRTGGDA